VFFLAISKIKFTVMNLCKNNIFLGAHLSKKMMVPGKETMMAKLSIISHKESWMIVMVSVLKQAILDGMMLLQKY